MRIVLWIGVLFTVAACGCASSRRGTTMNFPPPPAVLSATPTLPEVVSVVNRTANIRQLSSNSASVDVLSMNVPRLSGNLNMQRERSLRLQATIPLLLGTGVDLGSNDEVFWYEVPEGVSKTMYYARHDQYRQQLNRAIFPVDPTWVMDAMGMVQIDPVKVISGPTRREDGKLEIHDRVQMPDGMYRRVYFIEPQAGYVTHQFVYGPSGNEIARSVASNHVYYEQVQCAVPHQVELSLVPNGGQPLSMRISVGSYAVNQLLSGDPNLFTMPRSAANAVDLAGPGLAPPIAATGPTNYTADAAAAYPIRGTLR